MIEALKSHAGIIWRRRSFVGFFVAMDLLFPPMDLVFSVVFLPGIVLAMFGYFYLAGLMTLLVLPILALIVTVMLRYQRAVFGFLGLRIRRNLLGLFSYFLIYQFIVSPICVVGYARELLNMERQW